MKSFITLCSLGALLVISGCASKSEIKTKHYLIETSLTSNTAKKIDADVTHSPRYKSVLPAVRSVALRAPSNCSNEASSSSTGAATNQQTVIKTHCGVEMAELEKILVKQGYNVVSWNNTATDFVQAGRLLSVQVFFVVNSLEKVILKPASSEKLERTMFESDEYGSKFEKIFVRPEIEKSIYDEIGNKDFRSFSDLLLRGTMLDITAVDASTGQSIWFYQGKLNDGASRNTSVKTLVRCKRDTSCDVEKPESRDDDDDDDNDNDNDNDKKKINVQLNNEKSAALASADNAIFHGLLRELMVDFSASFASGR